jgi:uncharacterized protein (DUF305 family)
MYLHPAMFSLAIMLSRLVSRIRRAAPLASVALILQGLSCLTAAAQSDGPVIVRPGAPGEATRKLPADTRSTLPPVSPGDVSFMQGMIMHHAQAVEMTDLIEARTTNKDVRTLGARISQSQSDEMKFMRRWLEIRGASTTSAGKSGGHDAHSHGSHGGGGETLMPGMLTKKQMDALRNAKGRDFDRLFLVGMIQHHKGALEMVKELFDAPGTGQDAELFSFASDVDSGQRAEIRSMETLLSKLP